MGWTISIQLVRDRALGRAEVARLRKHVRASGLTRAGYAFWVAPPGSTGVIAFAGGKLARTPDPDEDADAAKLFVALTELHGLFEDARLELADDLHLVGWDGTEVTLVRDPDQELTPAPRDTTAWSRVPAPRSEVPKPPKAPAISTRALPEPLDDALAAVRAGGVPDDLSAVQGEVVCALLRAIARVSSGKHAAPALHTALLTVATHIPAPAVVAAALADVKLLDTGAATAVEHAMSRWPERATVREAVLAVWRLPPPAKSPDARWDAIGWALLMPLADDPWVIAQLGDEHDVADLETTSVWRRQYNRCRVLERTAEGVKRLIRRRRRDRETRPLTPAFLSFLAGERFEIAISTLQIELAVSKDRDEVALALARYRDPQFLPLLQRMLATDQYTRVVAQALHDIDTDEATAMLRGLCDHADPLVRIRAAQGLVLRTGLEAASLLVDAVRSAHAMGIWRHEHPPGGWGNAQLRSPADALAKPWRHGGAWPDVSNIELGAAPAADALAAAAIDRMLSPNPDIRRDAIELAHRQAILARDARGALTLARAERLHHALCEAAGLSPTTNAGSCSRVNVSNFWSSPMWRKQLKIPFDPMYKFDHVTWNWLEAHAGEHVEQHLAPALMDVHDEPSAKARAAAFALRPLTFRRSEWEAWNAREAALVEA